MMRLDKLRAESDRCFETIIDMEGGLSIGRLEIMRSRKLFSNLMGFWFRGDLRNCRRCVVV